MKKILSITISLCLIFASVLPVYAEAWTSEQAYQTNQSARSLVSLVTNIYSLLQTNFGSSGDIANMGLNIAKLCSWLVPDGYKPSDYHTLWEICLDMGTALYQYLPSIPSIASYVSSWMSTNNNYFNVLLNGQRTMSMLRFSNGSLSTENRNFSLLDILSVPHNYGTVPFANMVSYNFNRLYDSMLTDYTGQLGIWDSQGETLTHEGWSPTSAINGLYKYLAYTQRDLARLTYVLASDEEIETREKARETQTAVMDNFIDPEGDAAASTDNFGEIASGSANVKQNFSTGYSVSNMWGAFGSEHYGWFSQECADALDTSALSSSNNRLLKNDEHNKSDYDTPLLDEYYRQILSLGGGNVD